MLTVKYWKTRGLTTQEARDKVRKIQSMRSRYRARKTRSHFVSGQQYGNWTVPEVKQFDHKGKTLRLFVRCVCGTNAFISTANLRSGRSLGCVKCKMLRNRGADNHKWSGHGRISGTTAIAIETSARHRGIAHRLSRSTLSSIFEAQQGRCALSGVILTESDMSLDRISSTKGYMRANVQWVHKDVNYMKRTLSDYDFITWCRRIVAHADGAK